MNTDEMYIIKELCRALGVNFLEKKVWPTKEVEEEIRNDAVRFGFIEEKDKYKHSPQALQASMNHSFCWEQHHPDPFLAPVYKVKLDTVMFNDIEVDAKWFSEYQAAKTYLEIKFGKYGEIEIMNL